MGLLSIAVIFVHCIFSMNTVVFKSGNFGNFYGIIFSLALLLKFKVVFGYLVKFANLSVGPFSAHNAHSFHLS